MNFTWSPEEIPPKTKITPFGWVCVMCRAFPILIILVTGVVTMAILRCFERPIHGLARPWTPVITTVVCRLCLSVMGLKRRTRGQIMKAKGALVANHSSWVDIFALNAVTQLYFVSKAEVAGWPGIGLLARITGTVFIDRDRTQARAQQDIFETRLRAGHRLLFFPEGTSTDNFRVLPFKSTLFQAFFNVDVTGELQIQPLSVVYEAPDNHDPRFYGWWGDMDFGSHALNLLAEPRGGTVTVICHDPIPLSMAGDRKTMAALAEARVRGGMPAERQVPF